MSIEQQEKQQLLEYYEAVLATINTPGWRYLLEDWENQKAAFSKLDPITSVEQLYRHKGVVENLDYLLNLKEHFEKGYEQNFGGTSNAQVL